MTDGDTLALIHAEIDGELDGEQRAELARRLLSDSEARVLREDLRRLCQALDALDEVEPPGELRRSILDALPQSTPLRGHSWWSEPRIRYAAVIVAALTAGALVYEIVHGPQYAATGAAGTLTAAGGPTVVDAVRLGEGPVSGRVSLYRERAGLGLRLELVANAPVDLLIAAGGRTLRVAGVAGPDKPGQGKPGALTVGLPGFRMEGQTIDLTFLMYGRPVESARLRAPGDR